MVKWADAVKAYGKGRLKKGTEDYNECKKLYEEMKKQDIKKDIIIIEDVKKDDEKKENRTSNTETLSNIKSKKNVLELMKILKQNKKD